MNADPRIRDPDRADPGGGAERPPAAIAPDVLVVLRSPRSLRGTTAVVRRRVPEGWEVEVRSALGTPLHLTVPERAMLLL